MRRLARGSLWALLAFVGFAVFAFAGLRIVDPLFTGVQVQRRVEALFSGITYHRNYNPVPLAKISPHLQHAVVAAEDSGFFRHAGIDPEAMEKAWRDNQRRQQVRRGGSTITQQLVKNLFFTTHLRWLRKPFEIPLALMAELMLPKRRILELYLNVAEWGPGVFGAEAAAQHHFGVPASALTREQAAGLAACLPAPRSRHPQRMARYAGIILRRMQSMGW